MTNFIVQIVTSIFIGACFVYLAKRFQKSTAYYFCIGFFTSWTIRFFYLLIYGFITDFKHRQDFSFNRNLSVLLSIIIPYIIFYILRKKLDKEILNKSEINEIGEK